VRIPVADGMYDSPRTTHMYMIERTRSMWDGYMVSFVKQNPILWILLHQHLVARSGPGTLAPKIGGACFAFVS
jgi:hypothetical protein